MRNKRPLARLMAVLSIAIAFAGSFSGCARTDEQDTVDRLLSFLQNAEYPRIYQLLTKKARKSITLVDLSRRYGDIYGSIGLQTATCKLEGIQTTGDNSRTARFRMTVKAEKLGEFKLDMEARLLWESGKWLVDWTPELILPGLSEGDRAVLKTMPAKRGEIFDVNGDALAKNDFALSVCVDSSKVKNYETTIRLLAPILGMTETEIRNKLKSQIEKATGAWVQVEDDDPENEETPGASASPAPSPSPSSTPSPSATATASPEEKPMTKVIKAYPKNGLSWAEQQELLKIPGVVLDDCTWTVIRYYPYGTLLAQTLGYTGVMSQEDLLKTENAGLPADASIGKTGLERQWELYLRGQPGYELIIEDGEGKRKNTLAQKTGADGHDLRLSIDVKLQQRAEMLLREYLTPEMAGSIVVLDPKTGYLQAMASAPSFDPNLFSFPVDPEVMDYLEDPANMQPLYNRSTMGLYPPGSTFKPFTAAMGLQDDKITASFVFPYKIENDYWTPGDEFGFNTPIKRMERTPGSLNLQNAITYSDNIYFAYVALKVGGDAFYNHCLDLGLGLDKDNRMKFDLPLASSSITNTGKFDNLKTLADSGYGQGQFQITPLQMAALFGSLANGGDIMQPRIVQSVCHTTGPLYLADERKPEAWKKGVVSESSLRLLVPALKKVAQTGTAKDLNKYKNLKEYEICAKTGTAEITDNKTREIAWILGFTTKQELDRLVCVAVEVPAGEGHIRTEIAKRMFEE